VGNRVPRKRAEAGGHTDLSGFDDPRAKQAVFGIQDRLDGMQRELDRLNAIVPPKPESEEKDVLAPRVRALSREMDARIADARLASIALDLKIVQVAISSLPTASGAGDYIKGYIKGGVGDGSANASVKIAKPEQLRRTRYDGETYNGVAYVYSSNYARTADGVAETVTPNYVVGDVIYVVESPAGGTDALDENSKPIHWLDLNVDGRRWERASAAGGFIIGKITGHTSGQTYVISLYANGSAGAATTTGAACLVINVSASETLANNTWLAVTQLPDDSYEAITYGVLA
jgi:hypothetical protein